jgi:hypothetical protein
MVFYSVDLRRHENGLLVRSLAAFREIDEARAFLAREELVWPDFYLEIGIVIA